MADRVVIVFKNGEWVTFKAEELDIDLSNVGTLAGQMDPSVVNRFSYIAPGGEEKPLHLTPNEVAGIIVESGSG